MQILKKIIRSFILKVGGEDYLEKKLLLIGKIASKNNTKLKKINDLSDVEFSVFSQWGDDGIINWLTNNLPKIPKNFLEIGTQDYKEVLKWCRLAAEQGFAVAQSNLGEMYANGKGVTQDYIIAYMWFDITASNGHEEGEKFRDTQESKMTPEQITKAEQLARECIKKNYKDCG